MQQGTDQHAEADEQADLGHDLAEPPGDLLDGALGAQSSGEPEVHAREQQGDHRVDLEPDDEHDRGQDRDGRVQDLHGRLRSVRPVRDTTLLDAAGRRCCGATPLLLGLGRLQGRKRGRGAATTPPGARRAPYEDVPQSAGGSTVISSPSRCRTRRPHAHRGGPDPARRGVSEPTGPRAEGAAAGPGQRSGWPIPAFRQRWACHDGEKKNMFSRLGGLDAPTRKHGRHLTSREWPDRVVQASLDVVRLTEPRSSAPQSASPRRRSEPCAYVACRPSARSPPPDRPVGLIKSVGCRWSTASAPGAWVTTAAAC